MNKSNMTKMFSITSLCKVDIVQAFTDVKQITPEISRKIESMTDDEMKYLASKMADDYYNQLFWDSLRIIFIDRFLSEHSFNRK